MRFTALSQASKHLRAYLRTGCSEVLDSGPRNRVVHISRTCRPLNARRLAYPAYRATRSISMSASSSRSVTFLGQKEAQQVDEDLMGPLGFSVDQLMELAGLSVAQALASEFPVTSHARVLVIAGPGNNGGDGLVAGRHLHHFGYSVKVCYPKRTDKPLYHGLVKQLESLGIPFVDPERLLDKPLANNYEVVMDAIFGFSFKGAPRAPFDRILDALRPSSHPPTIVSVDSPSGWDVEKGDVDGNGLRPDMLVSLTAPKRGAEGFEGNFHYLGGRFVPPAIKEKFGLSLPEYPGCAQCVRIGSKHTAKVDPSRMRLNYDLAEKSGGLVESDVDSDPLKQFDRWFNEAVEARVAEEPNQMAVATADERGRPSLRFVLLKGYDERGFVFYTNYNSRKGQQLASNANAAMCMYWEPLQRSVRVEGPVERLSDRESDEYFHSRPRGSQIGAIVSPQSEVIEGGRPEIEAIAAKLKAEYQDESREVPRPQHWGGFRIRPRLIEFWHGRPSRLHDRLQFTRSSEDAPWHLERLAP